MGWRRAVAITTGGRRFCEQKDRRNRVSTSLRKPRWLARGELTLVGGAAFLASVAMPARAGMGQPGSALFGHYDISEPTGGGEFGTGVGDSILHLINPSGNANRGFGVVTN